MENISPFLYQVLFNFNEEADMGKDVLLTSRPFKLFAS
jgi:hypothetical protein